MSDEPGLGTLFDNDVLIKLAALDLLGNLDEHVLSPSWGVLGTARFVVPHYLQRQHSVDPSNARDFLRHQIAVEPTNEELSLANRIADAGSNQSVNIDPGESLLAAVLVHRDVSSLVTGDKRAIAGMAAIKPSVPELAALDGKIHCVEQVVLALTDRLGVNAMRAKVCGDPRVDKALAVCFGCHSPVVSEDNVRTGLESYIRDIRGSARNLLS